MAPDRLSTVQALFLRSIRSGTSEVVLTVAQEQDQRGTWALLRVRDRGLGIPADELPSIFERFFRGRGVAGQIAGSGLGLDQ